MRKLTLSLPKDLEEELASKLKKENLTDVEYLLKLIKNDLVAKIDLGEGFYYHNQSDRFYNSKNEEIIMTKIEKKLILTLLEQKEKIVPVDILIKRAWNKTNVSIYSFRNLIKKIRDKTYYELIKNHSNLGYSLNIPDVSIDIID